MESCPNKNAEVCGAGHGPGGGGGGWSGGLIPQVVAFKMTLCMRTELFGDREPHFHSGPHRLTVPVGMYLKREGERESRTTNREKKASQTYKQSSGFPLLWDPAPWCCFQSWSLAYRCSRRLIGNAAQPSLGADSFLCAIVWS